MYITGRQEYDSDTPPGDEKYSSGTPQRERNTIQIPRRDQVKKIWYTTRTGEKYIYTAEYQEKILCRYTNQRKELNCSTPWRDRKYK
jgi:hypothetical protein